MLEMCKFCGAMPTFKKHYVADNYFIGRKNFEGYYLYCDKCGYEVSPDRTFEKAAAIWNKENKEVKDVK